MPRVECAICYEKTRDVGELDACFHRFCFSCISRWADTENRCPMCKERFIVITRKRLPKGKANAQDPAHTSATDANEAKEAHTAAAAAAGPSGAVGGRGHKRGREALGQPPPMDEGGGGSSGGEGEVAESDEDPDAGEGPRKRLCGVVVETRVVQDKKQRWQPADVMGLDLDALRCRVCRRGDDDTRLLICDGCDNGYHTYCVGLEDIPDGEWFCPSCEEQRSQMRAARAGSRSRRRGRAARGAAAGSAAATGRRGRGRGRAAGPASSRSRSRGATGRGRRGAGRGAGAAAQSDSDSDVVIVESGDEGAGRGRGSGRPRRGRRRAGEGAEAEAGEGSEDGRVDDGEEEGDVWGEHGLRGGDGDAVWEEEEAADDSGGGDSSGDDGGVTLAALRARLGTTARTRAAAAARMAAAAAAGGPDGGAAGPSGSGAAGGRGPARGRAAAAGAGAGGSGDAGPSAGWGGGGGSGAADDGLDGVPLSQRRTVARARLYADQQRVEMMRRQWEAMRKEEDDAVFGHSTLAEQYRRQQQQQQRQGLGAPGGSGFSAAAQSARDRALEAFRAQRARERAEERAAAATARVPTGPRGAVGLGGGGGGGGGAGPSMLRPPAGGRAFNTGAYGGTYGPCDGEGHSDDQMCGKGRTDGGEEAVDAAWRALDRLRGGAGGGGGAGGRRDSGRTAAAAAAGAAAIARSIGRAGGAAAAGAGSSGAAARPVPGAAGSAGYLGRVVPARPVRITDMIPELLPRASKAQPPTAGGSGGSGRAESQPRASSGPSPALLLGGGGERSGPGGRGAGAGSARASGGLQAGCGSCAVEAARPHAASKSAGGNEPVVAAQQQRQQQQQQAQCNEAKAEEQSESADMLAFVGSTAGEQQPGSNPHAHARAHGPRSRVCCGGGEVGSRAPVPGHDRDRCCGGVGALPPRGAAGVAQPSSCCPAAQLMHEREGGQQRQEQEQNQQQQQQQQHEQQQGAHAEEAVRERLQVGDHGRERASGEERVRERRPRDAEQRTSAMGAVGEGQHAGANTSGPQPRSHPDPAHHRHHHSGHERRAVGREVKEAACRAIKDLMAPLFARHNAKSSEGRQQRQEQGQGATSSDGGSSGAGAQKGALLDKEAFKEVAREGTNELCAEVARMGLRGADAVRVVLPSREAATAAAAAAGEGAGADGGGRCELEDGEVCDSGGEVGGTGSLAVDVLVRVLEGRGQGHLVGLVREAAAGRASRRGQGGEGGAG